MTTVEEYKNELRRLHEEIKNNPFRRGVEENIRYGEAYYEKVYKFAETFYHLLRDIRDGYITADSEYDKMIGKIDTMMFIHDFYAASNRSENAAIKGDASIIHQEEEYLELCISTVHTYLDIGMLMKYPYKYGREQKINWAKWDTEKEDYIVKL
jgi:hypothetical protein